jgi:hypothetical protein
MKKHLKKYCFSWNNMSHGPSHFIYFFVKLEAFRIREVTWYSGIQLKVHTFLLISTKLINQRVAYMYA